MDLTAKEGSLRLLWSELPSVRKSGFLESVSSEERTRQEVGDYMTSVKFYLWLQYLRNKNKIKQYPGILVITLIKFQSTLILI